MKELITRIMSGKKTAILGFGREGRSTFRLLKEYLPEEIITIVDNNRSLADDPFLLSDRTTVLRLGDTCMLHLDDFDIIIKAPGIPTHALPAGLDKSKITSQTSLFLQQFGSQVIGVTGTKGKSTTSSLIHHIFSEAGRHALLVGNIGVPPFDVLSDISPETTIVMELSSHQLEYLQRSPHIAILLNIFQEHLDHYASFEDYQNAKLNIGRYQAAGDYFIFSAQNPVLKQRVGNSEFPGQNLIPYSLEVLSGDGLFRKENHVFFKADNSETLILDLSAGFRLPGEHNFANAMASAAACWLSGIPADLISKGSCSFIGLEHRIEYVGEYDGVKYYNDSIATIPEATIEAVKTLVKVDTLILGGYDRGIDYKPIYEFLEDTAIGNLIFIGEAGRRMNAELAANSVFRGKIYTASDYTEVVEIARKCTAKGMICLLSPAASSYDMFKNFEHRGNIYKKNVRN